MIPEAQGYIRDRAQMPEDIFGCWLWKQHRSPGGYGTAKWKGRYIGAHRLSFLAFNGEIPDGACVCHECDTPSCVNPDHLWLGSRAENTRDRDSKGRTACGERSHLSKLTAAMVIEAAGIRSREGVSYAKLALRYGVTKAAIRFALCGHTWKHLGLGRAA